MDWRVMTPAERRKEKMADVALAAFIGLMMAWFLVEALTK